MNILFRILFGVIGGYIGGKIALAICYKKYIRRKDKEDD